VGLAWFNARVLGFDRVSFFLKSKRRHFSKKKKTKVNGFAAESYRVNPPSQPGHIGFSLPPFFLQPDPVPAPDRPGPGSTCRAGPGFKTMLGTLDTHI
jgi:hypothetical protein